MAESFSKPFLKPCAPPGAWSHIVHSPRVTGGAIWASFDEAFYFPDGTHAGYAWHHGFWGIIDAWRRPKPEWWLTKMVFSPVWFPVRRIEYRRPARVRLPVENRYSFTDLSELTFAWEIGRKGRRRDRGPAAEQGPDRGSHSGHARGEKLVLLHDARGELVTSRRFSSDGQRRYRP